MYQHLLTLILATLMLLPTLSWGGGGTFTTPPTQIDPIGYTQGVYSNVYSCYNSHKNEITFNWASTSWNPYYCIYNDISKTFTTPPTQIDPIGYTQGVYSNVYSCYNSQNNETIFSWASDSPTKDPYYAIYNATSNTFTRTPTLINASYTQNVYANVFCCYNSQNNEIIFSWRNSNNNSPYYAIYNATSNTFTTAPTQIDAIGYTQGVSVDVFCCYNNANNEIIFSWADLTVTRNPYYCVYNATSNTFTTAPTQINATGYTLGVRSNIACCYNSVNNEIIFSWANNTGIKNPYYCVYNATSKTFTTAPTQIDATGYSQAVLNYVCCCYNSSNNEIIFSWANNTATQDPYYCVYNATSKTFTTLPTKINTSYIQGVNADVFCCYNNLNNEVAFTWADNTRDPYYAIYTEPFPPNPIPPISAVNRLLNAVSFSTLKPQKGVIVKSVSSEN